MPAPAKVDLEFDASKSLNQIQQQLNNLAKPITKTVKIVQQGGINVGGKNGGSSGGRSGGISTVNVKKSTSDLNEFNRSLDASLSRTLAFSASAGGLFAITKGFKAILSSTIDVEQSLANINSIFGLTSQELAKFGNSLFQVAKDTGTTFDEVSTGAADLARQGLDATESVKRLANALKLSKISGLDSADSVKAITVALNSFSSSALDSDDIVNRIAKVDSAFAVSSADIANALSTVGSAAESAGVSFNSLISLVASAAQKTGKSGNQIGGALNTIFTRLGRSKVQDVLSTIGVGGKNSDGSDKDTIELFKELSVNYDKLSKSAQNYVSEQVGGVRQLNILKALFSDVGNASGVYESSLRKLADTSNVVDERVKKLTDTFSGNLNKLSANATQFGSLFGTQLAGGALKELTGLGNSALETINKGFENKAEGAGLTIGQQIGVGITTGLGDALSGPGLAGIALILGKLFTRLGGDAVKAVGGIINPNKGKNLDLAKSASGLRPDILQRYQLGTISLKNATESILNTQYAITEQIAKQARLEESVAASSRLRASITPKSKLGFLDRAKNGIKNNLGGIGLGLGIGADIIGGAAGSNTKTGSIAGLVGNTASGAALGGLIGGPLAPITAVLGGFTGLALSIGNVKDAFDKLKISANESSSQAEKVASTNNKIINLAQIIQQRSDQISDVKNGNSPTKTSDLQKLNRQQGIDKANFKSLSGGLGIDINFDNASSSAEALAKALNAATFAANNFSENKNADAIIDKFIAKDADTTKDDVVQALITKLSANPNFKPDRKDLNALGKNSSDQEVLAAIADIFPKLSQNALDSFSKKKENLEDNPDGTQSFVQEDRSSLLNSLRDGLLKILSDSFPNPRGHRGTSGDFSPINFSGERKNLQDFSQALKEAIAATNNLTNLFAAKDRELSSQDFNRGQGETRQQNLIDLLNSNNQGRAANIATGNKGILQANNSFLSSDGQNRQDLRKSATDIVQNIFENAQKVFQDNIDKNANDSKAPKQLTESTQEFTRISNELSKANDAASVNKIINDNIKILVSYFGNGNTILKSLNDATVTFNNKQADVTQKMAEEITNTKNAVISAAQTLKLATQKGLFGGIKGFSENSRPGQIQNIQDIISKSSVASASAAKNPGNKDLQIQAAQYRQQVIQSIQDSIGGPFLSSGSKDNQDIRNGNALSIRDQRNNLGRAYLGDQTYQNYFGGTKGGLSDFIDKGGDIGKVVGNNLPGGDLQTLKDLLAQIKSTGTPNDVANAQSAETTLVSSTDANTKATQDNTNAILGKSSIVSSPANGNGPLAFNNSAANSTNAFSQFTNPISAGIDNINSFKNTITSIPGGANSRIDNTAPYSKPNSIKDDSDDKTAALISKIDELINKGLAVNSPQANGVAGLPDNRETSTNVALNIAINGSLNPGDLEKAAQAAFQPLQQKVQALYDSAKSGNKNKLSPPPSRGTINGQPAQQAIANA